MLYNLRLVWPVISRRYQTLRRKSHAAATQIESITYWIAVPPAVNVRQKSEHPPFTSRGYLNFVKDHRYESGNDSSVSLKQVVCVKQLQNRTTCLMRRRTWCHVSSLVVDPECGKSRTLTHVNTTTGLEKPWGFQEVEAPRFHDKQHMKVVRLSALRTGCLHPPGNIPGTHFC